MAIISCTPKKSRGFGRTGRSRRQASVSPFPFCPRFSPCLRSWRQVLWRDVPGRASRRSPRPQSPPYLERLPQRSPSSLPPVLIRIENDRSEEIQVWIPPIRLPAPPHQACTRSGRPTFPIPLDARPPPLLGSQIPGLRNWVVPFPRGQPSTPQDRGDRFAACVFPALLIRTSAGAARSRTAAIPIPQRMLARKVIHG